MFFLSILTNYILPIIYDSFVVLVLVLLFLFIFRIKDSNIRILFFFLPLIKPFIVILERIDVEKLYNMYYLQAFGIRFPDPTNIIRITSSPYVMASNPSYLILSIIIIAIFSLLLFRWISIALFYRRLACEEKVGREDVPDVYRIIDNFTRKIQTQSPDVSLTHSDYPSPFIIGIRRFVLVLSPRLLENLNQDEKDILIRHELSHIKRRDNLIGWIALILRDLNFFNPFGFIAYYIIRSEQEKACDKLVLKYTNRPPVEIAEIILNSLLKLKSLIKSKKHLVPLESSAFSPAGFFSQRRLENRVSSLIGINPDKIHMRVFSKILMYFLFISILFIQIVVAIKWNDFIILLR
jgi:beta-lactamase regulating signal transducer with metallopeptidase domain